MTQQYKFWFNYLCRMDQSHSFQLSGTNKQDKALKRAKVSQLALVSLKLTIGRYLTVGPQIRECFICFTAVILLACLFSVFNSFIFATYTPTRHTSFKLDS